MTTTFTLSSVNNQSGSSYFTINGETVLPTKRDRFQVAVVEGPRAEVQAAHGALQAVLDAGGTVRPGQPRP